MRSFVFFAAGAAAALVSAHAAQASTVLAFDDFESYGVTQANFTGFADLNVVGSVDLLQDAGVVSTPYGAGFVDLDGSAAGAGRLETDAFAFQAGDLVTFEFDYAGNRQGSVDTLFFGFRSPGLFTFKDVTITNGATVNTAAQVIASSFGTSVGGLSPMAPWTHLSFTFTAGSAGSLAAYVGTTSSDAKGPLLDNLKLSVGGPVSAAPEPAAWALMLLGFGAAGTLLRQRRAGVAAP
jgi:hypothetical protein